MNDGSLTKFGLLAGTAAALTLGAPAFAQDAPPAEETATEDQAPGATTQEAVQQEAAAEGQDIVVTRTLELPPPEPAQLQLVLDYWE